MAAGQESLFVCQSRAMTRSMVPDLHHDDRPVEIGAGELTWWTFAGGKINRTLKALFEEVFGWKAATDNLKVRLEGEGLLDGGFEEALERMATDEFWGTLPVDELMAGLPDYRLSKFQQVLPEWAQREWVSVFLLDLEGARRLLWAKATP